jgi:glycosyltransferase involved in cell wall biosynthesis
MMTKADLNIHSKYSNHPAEWFLQRLGASESYTEPEFIYQLAKERGMDFVTVTDHNRIDASLILKDEIRVPTHEYMQILESRGFELPKMKIFRRGIDTGLFSPQPMAGPLFKKRHGLDDGFNLLYVGRISRDKELPFLIKIYERLLEIDENWNLIFVGDGSYLRELKAETWRYKRVRFLGRVDYSSLPEIYSSADLFVFPSTTDTFGMVVLEAQACGLPALCLTGVDQKKLLRITGRALLPGRNQ